MDLKDSTMKGWVQSHGGPHETYQNDTGTGVCFSENFSFFLYHFVNTPYSLIYPSPVVYDLTNWLHHEITHFKEIKVVK
jgi:hypothetical protein